MKRLGVFAIISLVILAGAAFAQNVIKVEREFGPSFAGFAQNKCIVIMKAGTPAFQSQAKSGLALTGNRDLDGIAQKYEINSFGKQFPQAGVDKAARPTEQILARHYKAYFDAGTLEEVMAAYRSLPFVERVEPVAMHYMSATPNDGYYDDPPPEFPYDQWHYWDTYGIEADLGWDDETGDPNVVVAVVDGGVRYYHYDLGGTDPPGPDDNVTNGNIWVNDGEIPGNGVDDDNNGYVDDVIGWDFVLSSDRCTDSDCSGVDNDPSDFGGHGTHVSGTIAAITNNDPTFGVAGVAGGWNDGTTGSTANGVKVMCLRAGYMTRRGGIMHMDYCAEALFYIATMVDKGVNVAAVNCSWGSSTYGSFPASVDNLLAHDVMIIVAAGNANNTTADYLGSREDCLDVGATDQAGYGASFSTYGSWVDVAAPGVEILSTYHNSDDPDGDYISLMDGTSMSCPHVVGLAGLLESKDPSLTGPQKFDIIVNNTNPYLGTKYVGTGIISVKKALDAVGPVTNPPVANFSGTPASGDYPLTVNFTDLSTNGPTSWSWTFGDGGTSGDQNPTYVYTAAGTYTVSLTAANAYGSDTKTETAYITVTAPSNDPPVADFSGTPLSGDYPLTVDFTDLSTNSPTSWSWTFGDGGTSGDQNPTYTYTAAGIYTVSLTATNAYGSDTKTETGYVNVTEPVTGTLHVNDVLVTRFTAGRNCTGRAQISIYSDGGQPVAGATVTVSITGNTTETRSGTTLSDGSVTISTLKTKTCSGEWCFEVTAVTHASLTYAPGDNVVTMSCESGDVYSLMTGEAIGNAGRFELNNYPNPFNPNTTISFRLPEAAQVRLDVFNIMGQRIATLVDRYVEAGFYSVDWDGGAVASGIYFYRVQAGQFSETRKMVLMK